jgi:hypothetical protein
MIERIIKQADLRPEPMRGEESMNIEDKNEIISSKMSKFGKGFKIPDDKTDM